MVVLVVLVEVMLMAAALAMAKVIAIAMDSAIVELVSMSLSMVSMVYLKSLVFVL